MAQLLFNVVLAMLLRRSHSSEEAGAPAWTRSGYTVVRGVVPPDFVAELRNASNALLDAEWTRHLQQDRFTGSLIPVSKSPVFARLVAHEGLRRALTALGLSDLRWASGYIISKPPGGPSLAWHQDGWYWDLPDEGYGHGVPAQVFAMLYLSDTRRENGCLRVLPGSHLRQHALHALLGKAHSEEVRSGAGSGEAGDGDDQNAWAKAPEHGDWPGSVDVGVSVGDVVVGDARVLHGAWPNNSDERRTVLTLWYHPSFSKRSVEYRTGCAKLHLKHSKELYTDGTEVTNEWIAVASAGLLPSHVVAGSDVRRTNCTARLDEFDHSLPFMVRTPGWVLGGDERAERVWRAIKCGRIGGLSGYGGELIQDGKRRGKSWQRQCAESSSQEKRAP